MSLASFISSAVGGSLLGGILNIANGWFETLRKGKEAEIQIKLIEAQSASAEKSEAWKAFGSSQDQDQSFSIPEGVWPWAASLFVFVEALRRATRPALTWALLVFAWYAYASATAETKATLINDITFGSFTALFWWFGERYSKARSR